MSERLNGTTSNQTEQRKATDGLDRSAISLCQHKRQRYATRGACSSHQFQWKNHEHRVTCVGMTNKTRVYDTSAMLYVSRGRSSQQAEHAEQERSTIWYHRKQRRQLLTATIAVELTGQSCQGKRADYARAPTCHIAVRSSRASFLSQPHSQALHQQDNRRRPCTITQYIDRC